MRGPLELLWYAGPASVLSAPVDAGADGRWARAVALGAVARYAEATAILTALPTSRSASTQASFARQVGRHADAAPLDARALALAATTEDRADATSGTVADALGAGDADLARALLPAAQAAAADDGGWRTRTRLHWVVAELSLLADEAAAAAAEADEAVTTARDAGAPRHLTKSLLVRGVARYAAGDAAGGAADLLTALAQARSAGLTTLVWPAALVAAQAVPARAPELLTVAGAAAAAIAAGLGEQAEAFATRPDVAVLLQGAPPAR